MHILIALKSALKFNCLGFDSHHPLHKKSMTGFSVIDFFLFTAFLIASKENSRQKSLLFARNKRIT